MRFTNTWSPISSVFSIELEGISNACTTNVMINNPVTSTAASEARNSTVVSLGFSSTSLTSFSLFLSLLSFLATVFNPSRFQITKLLNYPITKFSSLHQPQRAVPARDLKDMRDRIGKVIEFITHGRRRRDIPLSPLHRPVNQQRPPNNIHLRHKSPVPAVVAIVPIVPHHKVMSFGNYELSVLDQLAQLQPPLRGLALRDVQPGETVAEQIVRGTAQVYVGFFQRHSIYHHLFVEQPHPVSGNPNHPLNKMLLRVYR